MRHAARRDDTEPDIVKALEIAGWTVIRLSDKGAPDLLAIRRGRLVPIECKSPGGTLTPAQEAAFQRWLAAGLPVRVAFTPADALAAVASGVEGVLPPLRCHVASCAQDVPCRVHGLAPSPAGHLVTPAYQKAQTAAVVPPKRTRTWPQHPDSDYLGDTPKASIPGKRARDQKKR